MDIVPDRMQLTFTALTRVSEWSFDTSGVISARIASAAVDFGFTVLSGETWKKNGSPKLISRFTRAEKIPRSRESRFR